MQDGSLATENLPQFFASEILPYFEANFPDELRILERCGVHPVRKRSLKDPFTRRSIKEDFSNIGEHCLAVAFCSLAIAEGLVSASAMDQFELKHLVKLALVHDAGKFLEILKRDASNQGEILDIVSPVQRRNYESQILSLMGLRSEWIEQITSAAKLTGRESLTHYLTCSGTGQLTVRGTLTEKILQLADNMTSTELPQADREVCSYFLTCAERQEASDFRHRYPFLWEKKLVRDQNGLVLEVDAQEIPEGVLDLGYLFQIQQFLSGEIAREISALLGAQETADGAEFMRDLVNSRLIANTAPGEAAANS